MNPATYPPTCGSSRPTLGGACTSSSPSPSPPRWRRALASADNQRPARAALAAVGVIRYLGHYDQVKVYLLFAPIAHLNAQPAELLAMSIASTRLVDGTGVERVLRALQPTMPDAMP